MRLLVVAYYFPPAGGPGVQRVLKLVKYLGRFGVQPSVLTVDDGSFPHQDAALGADIPPGTEVRRAPALDPLRLYARLKSGKGETAVPVGSLGEATSWGERAARFARANMFLPDARVGWVPYAARAARRWVDEAAAAGDPFGAVLTSGPPHSAHLVGLALKRARPALRWVADFRDPWTGINYYDELPMTAAARALDRQMERLVLRHAEHRHHRQPHLGRRARPESRLRRRRQRVWPQSRPRRPQRLRPRRFPRRLRRAATRTRLRPFRARRTWAASTPRETRPPCGKPSPAS